MRHIETDDDFDDRPARRLIAHVRASLIQAREIFDAQQLDLGPAALEDAEGLPSLAEELVSSIASCVYPEQ